MRERVQLDEAAEPWEGAGLTEKRLACGLLVG
jgi:hypothetical protein